MSELTESNNKQTSSAGNESTNTSTAAAAAATTTNATTLNEINAANINDELSSSSSSSSKASMVTNAKLIETWYQNYYMWNASFMLSCMAPTFQSNLLNETTGSSTRTHFFSSTDQLIGHLNQRVARQHNHHHNHHQAAMNRRGNDAAQQAVDGTERIFKVPSLFRRFMAEMLDAFYLQLIKIIIAMLIINYTDLIDEDSFKIYEFLEDIVNDENLNNIRVPVELFLVEIIYVVISVIFESFCLYKHDGFTPGKYMLNLKVISCVQVNEHSRNLVQIIPGTPLSIKSILIRTCLKNFSIIFLFPAIFFFLLPAFMEYGQTSYDKASESIVVQIVN